MEFGGCFLFFFIIVLLWVSGLGNWACAYFVFMGGRISYGRSTTLLIFSYLFFLFFISKTIPLYFYLLLSSLIIR